MNITETNEILNLKNEINNYKLHIERLEYEIAYMKRSKFWKLKTLYEKIKKNYKHPIKILNKIAKILIRVSKIKIKYFFPINIINILKFIKNNIIIIKFNKKYDGPLISVIIPCYNYGNYIKEAIESILNQTFKNYEIIVVDGGSTEINTINILKNIKSEKVKVIIRSGRHLVGDNRNFGILQAKGKYICCLDADDKLKNTYLEKALFFLEAYGYDVVYPSVQCFGNSDDIYLTGNINFEHMVKYNNSVSTVAVFRRDAWKTVKGYKDWPIGEGHVPEDWDFWTRMLGFGYRFRNLVEPLMLYRVHQKGLTALNRSTIEKQRLAIYEENKKYFDKKYKQLREYNSKKYIFIIKPFVNLIAKNIRKLIFVTFDTIEELKLNDIFLESLLNNYRCIIIIESSNIYIEKYKKIDIYILDNISKLYREKSKFIEYLIEINNISMLLNISNNTIYNNLDGLKRKYKNLIIHNVMFSNKYIKNINILSNIEIEVMKLYYGNSNIYNNKIFSLSIILNVHKEGKILEYTLKNLKDVINYQANYKLWQNIELIVILDNADAITIEIVDKYKNMFNKLEYVNYFDLSKSRNHGIKIAKNNFILISDGDDFTSLNCLVEIFKEISIYYNKILMVWEKLNEIPESEHIIIIHKYLMEFPNLYLQEYLDSNKNIVSNSLFNHFYTSKILCYRSLLENNPYLSATGIYGYEDWDFNNRMMSKGVKFKIANYILYYRRNKNNGMNSQHIKERRIVRNSNLYKINNTIIEDNNKDYKKRAESEYSYQTKYNVYKNSKKYLGYYSEKKIKINAYNIGNYLNYYNNLMYETKMYLKIKDIIESIDILLFAPWVIIGGADKLIIEYCNVLKNNNYKSCLVTTIKPGEKILDVKISKIDLFSEFKELNIKNHDIIINILLRAIINSNIKIIHIINSEIAYKMVKYYYRVLKEFNKNILLSVFCPDYDFKKNEYTGFPYLYPDVIKNADMIISDNNYWKNEFSRIVNKDIKYEKIFSPIDDNPICKNKESKHKKILWASRICNQKLINVLFKICKIEDEIKFIIYGNKYSDNEANNIFDEMIKLSNVEYRGVYNTYEDIDMEEFDLLLFTSKFEGISLIRLDMINHNLPIITSDVGDSTEIFGENYELLVKNIEDENEYCNKIDLFYSKPEYFYMKTKNIREKIKTLHNRIKFSKEYINIINKLQE